MGPNVTAFEEDLRKFVTGNVESAVYQDSRWPEATAAAWNLNPALKDTKVVCLSAGTAAVHLALLACGVGPGDEVCVQSFTFCASSHPITYLGATPVFIDSEPETWNMTPNTTNMIPKQNAGICQDDHTLVVLHYFIRTPTKRKWSFMVSKISLRCSCGVWIKRKRS